MEAVVSTGWLAHNLENADLRVFDATKYLPNEPQDGRAEFLRAHIPGARFFDIDEVADPDTDLPHMVPSPGRFARLMGDYGVSNNHKIIFYDQKGLASAARGWWLMGLFGHDRAAVLDGGLPKWRSEGRDISDEAPASALPGTFVASFRSSRLRGIGDMLSNLEGRSELVLDARAAGRFTGTSPELRAGMASGHIPGSRNLPYLDLLNADHTLRPPADLRVILAKTGVDGTRAVVTTCGSGVTATILTLAMRVAGLPDGAVFDGSWTEYGLRLDTPKAVGRD